MIFGFTFVTLISILAVAGVAVYSLKLRHELRLRELEAQSGHPASHPLGREASDLESAVLPDSALQEIHEEGPEEAPEVLPAYVDPEDEASMAAWRKAQTELDQAW